MLLQKMSSDRPANGVARPPVPFIVGAGRSGTTLLRLMLDAHPDLAIPIETHFIPELAGRCREVADPRQAFLDVVTGHRRWGSFGIDEQVLQERVAQIEPFDLSEGLRAFFLMYSARFGKSRWGDKTPPYVQHMRLIQELLPEARFIHLIRDGRDVALSIKDLWFGPNSIADAAQWWCVQIWQARAQVEQLDNYLEVKYEDLITDTEETLAKVCDFVELSLDPTLLRYYEQSEGRMAEMWAAPPKWDDRGLAEKEKTNIAALTAKPPQPDRIGVWRREMSADDQEYFDLVAGDVLREFGYPLAGDTTEVVGVVSDDRTA